MDRSNRSSKLGDYFQSSKLILRICGISFRNNDSILYCLYSVFVMCMLASLLFVEVYGIIVHITDVDNLTGFIAIVFQHFLGLFKIIILKKNRAIVSATLQTLHDGCFTPNTKRGGAIEGKLIKECNHDILVQSAVYYIAGALTIGNAIVIALRTKRGQDDYHSWEAFWLPFELFQITTSTTYYIVYVYCSVAVIYFSVSIMATDLLITSAIKHVTTQFVILGNSIRSLAEHDVEYSNDESCSSYLKLTKDKLHMKAAIVYHQEVIKVTEKLENLFNTVILCQFIGSIFVLCGIFYKTTLIPETLTGGSINTIASTFLMYFSALVSASHPLFGIEARLQLHKNDKHDLMYILLSTYFFKSCSNLIITIIMLHIRFTGDQRIIREYVFLFTMTTQLFIYCYCGNELTLSSASVNLACYEVDFIDRSLWFRRNLLMIMMRSQKPVVLTAGKFTALSLPVFVSILRASYSSSMVLRNAN